MIEKRRRLVVALCVLFVAVGCGVTAMARDRQPPPASTEQVTGRQQALTVLRRLAVKARASKAGYARTQFLDGWEDLGDCDIRNFILARDMVQVHVKSAADCSVMSGTLHDPYTGKTITFIRGPTTSGKVQIDHVVALSDAWQTGAQDLTAAQRYQLSNDPLELLAVDGQANEDKSDGDAEAWLPPNKDFRCRYVARQVAVKQKYHLWVTAGEDQAIATVLSDCPGQPLPVVQ